MSSIPVIDVSPLLANKNELAASPDVRKVAKDIQDAFTSWGFFQIVGHDIAPSVQKDLLQCATEFFALPEEEKLKLHVKRGGPAWRGYMPLGGEGTHGRVDHKEGMYCGPEHPADHPHIGLPLHGTNQFPDASIPHMPPTVLAYIDQIVEVGKTICDAVSLGLDLERNYIREHYLQPEPVALFRSFKYSAPSEDTAEGASDKKQVFGIGEHTDFGLITLLSQHNTGLQVLSPTNDWVDVPVIENALVCNVGDMLDMLTGGRLKSRPHRVLPPAPGTSRISFPFFFDFSWTADMRPLPLEHLAPLTPAEEEEARARWARWSTFTSVQGQWWQYLAKKVQKVFPEIALPDFEPNSRASSRFTIAVASEA